MSSASYQAYPGLGFGGVGPTNVPYTQFGPNTVAGVNDGHEDAYEDEGNQRSQVRDRKAMRGSPIAKELQDAFFYEGAAEESENAANRQQLPGSPAQQQMGQSMASPMVSKYASPVRVPAPAAR